MKVRSVAAATQAAQVLKVINGHAARMLVEGRQSAQFYRRSQRASKVTRRQPDQKPEEEYGEPQEEPLARAEEQRQREAGWGYSSVGRVRGRTK
jgi:hypothetical protein